MRMEARARRSPIAARALEAPSSVAMPRESASLAARWIFIPDHAESPTTATLVLLAAQQVMIPSLAPLTPKVAPAALMHSAPVAFGSLTVSQKSVVLVFCWVPHSASKTMEVLCGDWVLTDLYAIFHSNSS